MSRAKLLRYLDDMHKDAFSVCGSRLPDECDEMRDQHDLTHRILTLIVRRTSGEAVKELFDLQEKRSGTKP